MESTPPSARIPAVDVLRGVAVLGMLAVTVGFFSTPMDVWPATDLSGEPRWQLWVWGLRELLLQKKVATLVCLLFGASIGLAASKRLGRQLWRQVTLLGIAAAHGYGLWVGDVLVILAASGVLVLLLKSAPQTLLVLLGVLGALAPVHHHVWLVEFGGGTETEVTAGAEAGMGAMFNRPDDDYVEQVKWRAELMPRRLSHWPPFIRSAGYMLLGLALLRMGFLSGAARRNTYAMVAAASLPTGLGLAILGFLPALHTATGEQNPLLNLMMGGMVLEVVEDVSAGMTALGISALVLLLCSSGVTRRLLTPVAALGRMALSCYLLQTLICALVYEGWAGDMRTPGGMLLELQVAGGVAIGLLLLCPLWLAHFRHGPAEWLWRSLTHLSPQKMGVGSSS